jgi:hypothetical protein
MPLQEPQFRNERELEDAIRNVIDLCSQEDGEKRVVTRGFGLDLAVFANGGCRFFEVKAFFLHRGRCGFGNQKGEGNQIRLLFDFDRGREREPHELRLYDPSVRWVLGNGSLPLGSARYTFFTCSEAQAAAAAGVRPGKQNNLRISAFDGRWVTWSELVQKINGFVRSAGPEVSHLGHLPPK